MTENLVRAGSQHVKDMQQINQELIEKTLRMRCLAYLHQVKSELLTQTIYSLSETKKVAEQLTCDLSLRTDLLEQQREIIRMQRDQLEQRNDELEAYRCDLEEKIAERTQALQERIEEESRIQWALRASEARYRDYAKIFQSTADGLMITDSDTRIVEINPALTRLTGFSERESIGQKARFLFAGDSDARALRLLSQSIEQDGSWQGELAIRHKGRVSIPAWVTITAVNDKTQQTTRYVVIFSDISQIKESESKLDHLAHHDVLTGLPNRLLFNSRLEHALSRARRQNTGLALLFLDLDGFKTINDTFGHPAGDELLRRVGTRLIDSVREEDTVARLSGDEFIIILEDVDTLLGPGHVAEKLLESLQQPMQLEGREIFISASIGISLYPADGCDVTTLVRNADVAMYRAKERGRNNRQYYKAEMTNHAFERLDLENKLRRALERDELTLEFQPQFDLTSGQPVCLEALVRWRHPELGLIPPAKFIPIAEETGLIESIGHWVIHQACREMANWRNAGLEPCRIALNLSIRQLDLGDIIHSVQSALRENHLPAGLLELELTETALMSRPEHHIHTLEGLKEIGIGLAIDDFGTGYSSLAYLKRFPVDRLKIDLSFVQGVPENKNDAAIIHAILAMSRSLGLEVVAEGVENEAQRCFLSDAGCDQAQGFLLGAPESAEICRGLFTTQAQAN